MQKHKIIFGLNLVIILTMIGIYFGTNIPEIVPVHYDINGDIDAYGKKQNLLMLLAICLVLSIGLYYLSKNPQKANYPYKITDENRESSYRKMQNFIGLLSLISTFIFFVVFLKSSGLLGGHGYVQYIIYFLMFLNPLGLIYFLRTK